MKKKNAFTWSDTTGPCAEFEIPNTLLELGKRRNIFGHPTISSSLLFFSLVFFLFCKFFFFHIFLFFNFLFFFLPPSLLSLLSPSLLSVQLYRLQQGHTRFYPLSLEKVALWQGLDTLRRGLLFFFFFFFYLYITYILSWQPDAPRRWAKITN